MRTFWYYVVPLSDYAGRWDRDLLSGRFYVRRYRRFNTFTKARSWGRVGWDVILHREKVVG